MRVQVEPQYFSQEISCCRDGVNHAFKIDISTIRNPCKDATQYILATYPLKTVLLNKHALVPHSNFSTVHFDRVNIDITSACLHPKFDPKFNPSCKRQSKG